MQEWYARETQRTLHRLMPRLEAALAGEPEADVFLRRLEAEFPRIFQLLVALYGDRYDFYYHLEAILMAAVGIYRERPAALRALDRQREAKRDWFNSEQMLGAVYYVDLFAGDLAGLRAKIPYLTELGVTYLHLMPLFACPDENSDGGYAVSDYRQVNPALGTMAELAALATDLRASGISLVLDFVFNHTSDEHGWAQRALRGDPEYQEYYYLFPDRTLPDQYQATLREIFPEQAPGAFTYRSDVGKWVWTTFHPFQWDLNYSNPAVFNAMLGEMLYLANQGVEVLRLDAVAFIWKQMGTSCENLPQAHMIIRAMNAFAHIVAPAMVFKSEAIVHPRDVATYISWDECPISYNPTLMALLWESLATRKTSLLRKSMQNYFALPPDCAWVNYIRCHDDIGWTFADEDSALLGINGFDHRQFLNRFYIGRFEGSFATGVPFNYNPQNQDMRITGTAASLAGLEQGLRLGNAVYIEHALKRLLLIHSVIVSAGGIPLIYLGDEIATLNDYSYEQDAAKREDSRWIHRPRFDWERAADRDNPDTPQGWLYTHLAHLIGLRKQTPAFASGRTQFIDAWNEHVFGYVRGDQILVLANFSESDQLVRHTVIQQALDASGDAVDMVTGETLNLTGGLVLGAYQFRWLKRES